MQAATAVINNKNGSLCAMIGGREHEGMRVYNRAKARRQPGSCIKPVLVYAPAFENKSITAATMLDDYRKDFNGYSPTNFKEVYYGKVTVRKALSLSLNVPAVEVLEKNGIEYSKDYARKMGIVFDDSDNYLALALGGMRYGASPTEIAGAYRTFAFSGNYIKPWCIEKICDSSGNVLYKHEQQETKVLRESTAYIITDILRDVSKQKSNLLSRLQYNVACKTGTVGYKESGYSDAWCTAYDSNFTVCTWLGYDKTTDDQMLEKSVTGSSYPAGICASVFEKTFNEYGFGDFVQPSSVIKAGVDAYTLNTKWVLCAAGENTSKNQVLQEYFEEGTQPEAQSDYWHEPAPANDFSVQLNEVREVTISLTPSQEFAEYHIYRKNSSGESLIKKISGEANKKIEFIDGDYTQGDVYYYIPVHKYVISNGAPLAGKKSEEIFLH